MGKAAQAGIEEAVQNAVKDAAFDAAIGNVGREVGDTERRALLGSAAGTAVEDRTPPVWWPDAAPPQATPPSSGSYTPRARGLTWLSSSSLRIPRRAAGESADVEVNPSLPNKVPRTARVEHEWRTSIGAQHQHAY